MTTALDMALDDVIKINKQSSGSSNRGRARPSSGPGPARRLSNRSANRTDPYSTPKGFEAMSAMSYCGVVSQTKLLGSNLNCSTHRRFPTSCRLSEGSQDLEKSTSRVFLSLCSSMSDKRNGMLGRSHYCSPIEKRNPVGQTFCSVGVCTHSGVDVESNSHAAEERVGVLLLNLGGPDTLDDVQPFLFNLFADPDIIRLPRLFRFLQKPLAKLISVLRASKSKEGYASIGGGSPLRKITYEQADALKMALEAKNMPVNVYVGMRYWYPFTEEAIFSKEHLISVVELLTFG